MDQVPPQDVLEAPVAPLARDRICVVRLRTHLLGVPGHTSQGIFKIENYTQVPRSPSFLLGITNLRGMVAPVLDLGPPLSLAKIAGGQVDAGLVVDWDGASLILAVDEILAFEPADLSRLLPLSEGGPTGDWDESLLLGCFEYRGEQVRVLDLISLIARLKIKSASLSGQASGGV